MKFLCDRSKIIIENMPQNAKSRFKLTTIRLLIVSPWSMTKKKQEDRKIRGTRLILKEREKIDAFNEQGLTVRAISKRITRLPNVIGKYLRDPDGYEKRLLTRGNTKTSAPNRRTLLREASKRGASSSQLCSSLQLLVSKHCVQQVLRARETLSFHPFKKAPPLT